MKMHVFMVLLCISYVSAHEMTENERIKWTKSCEIYDHDNSGILKKADYEYFQKNLFKTFNLKPDGDEPCHKLVKMAWTQDFHENPDSQMTVAQCVEGVKAMMDTGELTKDTEEYANAVFDCATYDTDGVMTFKDYSKVYKAVANLPESVSIKAFKKIDTNGNGIIHRDEFSHAYIAFFTDPEVKNEDYLLFDKT